MVRTPADGPTGGRAARGTPDPPGDHAAAVQVIGHAGLAIQSGGGSPTRRHPDAALVIRHDVSLADGRPVADVGLRALRRAEPGLLTLDETMEHLDGRATVLLDLKTARATQLLGRWLNRRRDVSDIAICTENIPWLLHLRFAAPRAARWPTFPDLGERRAHHVQRVVVGLLRSHASVRGLQRGLTDIRGAAGTLRRAPHESLSRLGGMPWRERLPRDLARTCDDTAAAGICVHHWLVSPQLVDEGRRLGLHVNAWTVNNPFAARMVAAAGVDSITTDRVDLVRIALRAAGPRRPDAPTRLRVEASSAPR